VEMSGIHVHGLGAVSPAGWNVAGLREALEKNVPLPFQNVTPAGMNKPLRERKVPAPVTKPAYLAHPRLRRATSIAQYTVAAALEAIGNDITPVQSGALRLGIIVGVLSGCINYTRRFYEEVLREPAMASPLIFPETVFNSPASHLGAYLGSSGISYTLVGDDGAFLQALALAAHWLADGRVDACVVIGAEENDWISADAISLFQRNVVHSAGAGALYLKKISEGAIVELSAVTDSISYTQKQNRAGAAGKMRTSLPAGSPNELLCDSRLNIPRMDAAENQAWANWPGERVSPKIILGEAFVASAAWQCVTACDALDQGRFSATNVSVVGANQQAIGARFTKLKP
jgi:hypothetical protein